MLATPDWRLDDLGEDVYEPSEDTFLLLDALEAELPRLVGGSARLVVELGSGAGLVIAAVSRALQGGAHCVAVDINPAACRATQATAALNDARVEVIRGDLLECLLPGAIDLLIFNPPYVVTHADEIYQGDGINRSYAGGARGRQVMDRLFPQLPRLMSARSCFYMVVIDENEPQEIAALLGDLGFESSVVMRRRAGIERLSVMKFVRL
ncbi:hypothetical protein LSTR_LSTR012355 [Laodelphax striatellus]|uniref:Methyltransferase HEMK2 n=1 Tax=Laodelphax striatellus TaxID=195883 RepID=A0A482WL13_LAOST|nr:hypothetical protein LSTR_LSTR012355 [Laodelphax striatellus]